MAFHSPSHIFAMSGVITFAIQFAGFAAAFALQRETFYDIFGGLNFLAMAYWTTSTGSGSRSFTTLFVIARLWLLLFLAWRAHKRKGDSRLYRFKKKLGMFLLAWMVQGMWVFLISIPFVYVKSSSPTDGNFLATFAIVGFSLGIMLEVLADVQKVLWVRRKRPGGFCTSGLWKFSRHPNYFGEMLQWWSAWLLCLEFYNWSFAATILLLICALSPPRTLMKVSATGVCNAELKRYYDSDCVDAYIEYRNNTSILVPFVGYGRVPLWMKRSLFLDLERWCDWRPNKKV